METLEVLKNQNIKLREELCSIQYLQLTTKDALMSIQHQRAYSETELELKENSRKIELILNK